MWGQSPFPQGCIRAEPSVTTPLCSNADWKVLETGAAAHKRKSQRNQSRSKCNGAVYLHVNGGMRLHSGALWETSCAERAQPCVFKATVTWAPPSVCSVRPQAHAILPAAWSCKEKRKEKHILVILTAEQFPSPENFIIPNNQKKIERNEERILAHLPFAIPSADGCVQPRPPSGEEHKQCKPHVCTRANVGNMLSEKHNCSSQTGLDAEVQNCCWINCCFLRQLRRATEALSWFRNHTAISLVQLLCVDNKNAWLKGKGEQAEEGGGQRVKESGWFPSSRLLL